MSPNQNDSRQHDIAAANAADSVGNAVGDSLHAGVIFLLILVDIILVIGPLLGCWTPLERTLA